MDSITEKLLKVYSSNEEKSDSTEKITKDKVIEETWPYADYNLNVPAGDYLKSILDKPKEERNFIERSMLSINKSYKTNKIKMKKPAQNLY